MQNHKKKKICDFTYVLNLRKAFCLSIYIFLRNIVYSIKFLNKSVRKFKVLIAAKFVTFLFLTNVGYNRSFVQSRYISQISLEKLAKQVVSFAVSASPTAPGVLRSTYLLTFISLSYNITVH